MTDLGSNFEMVWRSFFIVRPVSMMSSTIRMFLPRMDESMFSMPMIFTSENFKIFHEFVLRYISKSILKPRCHIPFLYVFTALRSVFEVLTLVVKIS